MGTDDSFSNIFELEDVPKELGLLLIRTASSGTEHTIYKNTWFAKGRA